MFLDSANLADVQVSTRFGVTGITLNPTLIARVTSIAPLEHLELILEEFSGAIFYQPIAQTPDSALQEARAAYDLAPEQVGIKLLAMPPYYEVAEELLEDDISCALTAVYSAGQAMVANDLGCDWIIPYVDRAQKLMPETKNIVESLREILDALDSDTGILAASIKSSDQAIHSVFDGADEISAPIDVIQALVTHPLTESAAAEFAMEAQKLGSNEF